MFRKLLEREFSPYGSLSRSQLGQLEAHYSLLVRWNQRINLTRIHTLVDVVRFHYCESLFLGVSLPMGKLKIIDVGSGGGFPGVPVAILRPDCTVDLAESHQRKSVFLREACRKLGNVRVVNKRAEAIDPEYDWAIARAVRPEGVIGLGLAPNVALLTGETELSGLADSVTTIPWGAGRRLVKFHVKRGRSRDKI